jgi:hypothetical protein
MNLLQSRLGQKFPYQQDNDPNHTAKTKQEWLRDMSLNILEGHSQSPDSNPIEHVLQLTSSNLSVLERPAEKNGRNFLNTRVTSL